MAKFSHKKTTQCSQFTASTGDHIYWDERVRNLGLRTRNGKKAWVVQTRLDGISKKRTLGNANKIKLSQARVLAQECLDQLHISSMRTNTLVTVKEFASLFLNDCKHLWKPSTLKANRSTVRNQILPTLSDKPIRELDHQDIVLWHNNLERSAGTRNRALAILSSMMQHAEIVGIRPPASNPCKFMRKHQTGFKATYMDAHDYAALGNVLRIYQDKYPAQVAFIRFLALTGCRKGEVETMQWTQIEGNCIALPDSKNGPKAIWIGKSVKFLLRELPQTGP